MTDEAFMARAIRLADLGLYTTDPNPRVGCVLVRDGEILSEGYHRIDGQAHAEADALANLPAGTDAKGATAYVTLEPCSFVGRTPSCAHSLVEAGVTRVVAAMADPHPGNRGLGFDVLRNAGIEVVTPFMEASSRALNPGHMKKYESGRPFVRLKLAMSLDGRTALRNGESKWITGPDARRDVQRLRARSSALVTGAQTVIDDDPGLDVRPSELGLPDGEQIANRRRPVYILDANGRVPSNARLFQREDVYRVAREAGDNTLACALDDDGRIDLHALLTMLAADHGHNELLFECGGTLGGKLIAEGLADEVIVYVAPKLMGDDARPLLQLPELDKMSDVHQLTLADVRQFGDDIRLTYTPQAD